MSQLDFSIAKAAPERFAAVPILQFRLHISETTGQPIHAIALRCQVQIDTTRRFYSPVEQEGLLELFGDSSRWGTTLKPLVWTHASLMIPGFQDTIQVNLPITCTYDFDVVAAKYLQALDNGDIPLRFLFSGTVFVKTTEPAAGFTIEQIPWEKEALFRLPVRVWRELMDGYFPGTAWIRLSRGNVQALHRFKAQQALPSWDLAIEALLKGVNEKVDV